MSNLSKHLAITDSETLDEVMKCLSKHLNISTQGAYNQDYLLKILVKAASVGDTIENTIKSLKEVSSSNTIRYHLNKLNDFDAKETIVAILTYLLAELDGYNLQINKLYLDRGFFTVAVIRWLQALDIPFSMPAIRKGKKGGINQFLVGRKSYKTTYTMTSKQGDSVTFELAIICKYRKGQRKKKGIEYLVTDVVFSKSSY